MSYYQWRVFARDVRLRGEHGHGLRASLLADMALPKKAEAGHLS